MAKVTRNGRRGGATPRRRIGVGEAALRGAAAGLIGGAVLMAARRLEERRVLSGGGAADADWGVRLAGGARRRGFRLRGRQRAAAGVGTHLAYSALLGALFGILQSRADRLPGRLPVTALRLLEDGLAHAAGIPRHGLAPGIAALRGARGRLTQGLIPLRTDAVFGIATRAAFRALTKGAVR